jgi:hypothetical protein
LGDNCGCLTVGAEPDLFAKHPGSSTESGNENNDNSGNRSEKKPKLGIVSEALLRTRELPRARCVGIADHYFCSPKRIVAPRRSQLFSDRKISHLFSAEEPVEVQAFRTEPPVQPADKSTSNLRPSASAHLYSVASVGLAILTVSNRNRAGASNPCARPAEPGSGPTDSHRESLQGLSRHFH